MAGPPASLLEHTTRTGQHALDGSEKQCRVEVSLYPAVVPPGGPCLIYGYPPVDADHIAAGFAQLAEESGRVGAEVNRGHREIGKRAEDLLRVRENEFPVVS